MIPAVVEINWLLLTLVGSPKTVEAKAELSRGVETKSKRLLVDTKFRRLFVETKLRRLAEERNPEV